MFEIVFFRENSRNQNLRITSTDSHRFSQMEEGSEEKPIGVRKEMA
jgi:hypothetical protein